MSVSDILAALLLLLVPLRHSKADRRMAKDTFALIQDMVVAYSSPFFNASGSARRLWNNNNNNIAKTCLPPSMLRSSPILHVQGCSAPQIFSKQQMSPFELSSCCSCHVFSYYFGQILLLKRVKCPPFCFHNQNNSTSSPGLLS